MSRPETEILVHIAAPARAADDTNYRALAAAYLDFEPTSQTCVVAGEQGAEWGVSHDLEAGEADWVLVKVGLGRLCRGLLSETGDTDWV